MSPLADPWVDLVNSIRRRRSYDARFFKPVCLIAAIDAVAERRIDPENMDAEAVIARFRDYVAGRHPERAGLGWRPLWHLSNDNAWIFTHGGRRLLPEDFGAARKPNSRGQLFTRFDRLAVPESMLPHWRSAAARELLRNAMLAMLEADNQHCRSLGQALKRRRPPSLAAAELSPSPAGIVPPTGQGFQSDPRTRRVIERYAIELATSHLENEGWTVEDLSAFESYDLLCKKADDYAFVEVKGTTGSGDQILLTDAEAEFAQANKSRMMLIVVAGIRASLSVSGDPIATHGAVSIYRAWAPTDAQLHPISYLCDITLEITP